MRKAMKILSAVDGSEPSLAAVEEAARTPWPEGSIVRIVSVTDIPFPTQQVENTAQAMARFGEIAGARTEVTAKTLKGDPKIAILDEAERWGADLVALGSHGRRGFSPFLLASASYPVPSHP